MFASKRGTVSGFFLAGRFMSWIPIGASLFASNIGSEHFIGLAGSGAASGLGVGAFELNASILLQLLGWVFLPVYIASGVCTLPEYMKRRFGGIRIQVYLAGLSLLLYVFTKISVNLYSGSLFLTEALQWNIWVSILLILAFTSLITITGGLAAVIYTDTLQCFIMVAGALVLAILSYIRVGGLPGIVAGYGRAIPHIDPYSAEGAQMLIDLVNISALTNSTSLATLVAHPDLSPGLGCSIPSPKAFRLLREVDDPDMPWLGFILGQTPASIWYWCADQMMVQRVLAAKSLSHAQGGTLMAGVIKQLPLFIMVIPGMVSRMLYPNEVACIPGEQCLRVCGQRNGCSNLAYPKLVVGLMPSGLRGLMLSVMLAALISDLTSIFNSASTLFTVDIYQRFRKNAREAELMIVGRVFVVVLVMVSIAWVPVIQQLQGSQLFIYIQAVSACLAPPIASIYLLAILWKRSTESGAFCALVYGLIVGLVRMILTIIYSEPVCGETDLRPAIVSKVHYMYFALFSFLSSGLILVIISFFSERPKPENLHRLTYWTAWDQTVPAREVTEGEENGAVEEHYRVVDVLNMENQKNTKLAGDVVRDQPYGHNFHQGFDTILPPNKVNSGLQVEKCPEHYVSDTEVRSPRLSCPCACKCESRSGRCLLHLLKWFCGCEDRPCLADEEERCLNTVCCGKLTGIVQKYRASDTDLEGKTFAERYAVRLQKIISLSQDPRAKCALRVGLLTLLIISLFGFIFFSVYFGMTEAGPLQIKYTANESLPDNISSAILLLERLGVVVRN
ncbi:hypothetical protein CRM22_007563 [Opisthorchis felineus]|uniref:Sodium/myo-inositol cotransporter n=2 Tax=Opisthorchis felineus TaxID=147828 RepID=A0A4S2LHH7_OPIFE|nr:hypothetical protein CRM22_007563 [Opisthorchis felineus]